MCVSLVGNGMDFYAIESLVLERRMETYARGISHYHLHQHFINTQADSKETQRFSDTLLSKSPSNSVFL